MGGNQLFEEGNDVRTAEQLTPHDAADLKTRPALQMFQSLISWPTATSPSTSTLKAMSETVAPCAPRTA